MAGGTTNINIGGAQQVSFLIRALYFIFIGWWAGLVWSWVAYALFIFIVTIPVGVMMFQHPTYGHHFTEKLTARLSERQFVCSTVFLQKQNSYPLVEHLSIWYNTIRARTVGPRPNLCEKSEM